MKKTSQRSLLFRQNVNRTEEEWVHFLDGYRKALIEFDMKKFGDDWHTAEDIVEEIFVDIVREPRITALRPQDSFRHVLINMCMQKHKSFTKPWRRRLAERLSVALCLTMRTQDDARREIAAGAQRRALSYDADAGRRKARNRGGVPRPRSCGLGRRYPRRWQGVYRLLPRGPATVAEASRVRGGCHGQGGREESADRRVNLWPLVSQGRRACCLPGEGHNETTRILGGRGGMDIGDVINGWRIVEDAGAGRSGHVFIVCREVDPDRLFALKMQQTDRPDVAPDANAREAALLRTGMKKSPRVMPALVEVGEWRGVPSSRRSRRSRSCTCGSSTATSPRATSGARAAGSRLSTSMPRCPMRRRRVAGGASAPTPTSRPRLRARVGSPSNRTCTRLRWCLWSIVRRDNATALTQSCANVCALRQPTDQGLRLTWLRDYELVNLPIIDSVQ